MIGNRQPAEAQPLADRALMRVPADLPGLAERVLVAMYAREADDDRGWTSDEVARRLSLRPWTPERQALTSALTWLRTGRLVLFERQRNLVRHITGDGRAVAGGLSARWRRVPVGRGIEPCRSHARPILGRSLFAGVSIAGYESRIRRSGSGTLAS